MVETVSRLQLCYKEYSSQILLGKCTKNQLFRKNKESLFLRKKSIVEQRLNKAAALQYRTLNFIKKVGPMQDLSVEAPKVLIYSQVNILGLGFFFTESAGLEFIPAISLTRTPSQRFFQIGPARQLLNHRHFFCEISLQNIF